MVICVSNIDKTCQCVEDLSPQSEGKTQRGVHLRNTQTGYFQIMYKYSDKNLKKKMLWNEML